jgi:hypothetical protein
MLALPSLAFLFGGVGFVAAAVLACSRLLTVLQSPNDGQSSSKKAKPVHNVSSGLRIP